MYLDFLIVFSIAFLCGLGWGQYIENRRVTGRFTKADTKMVTIHIPMTKPAFETLRDVVELHNRIVEEKNSEE